MEKIQAYLAAHPAWAGVLFIVFGSVCLLACVQDWDCVFGQVNTNNVNLFKIDGLVNLLGRKTARIVFGLACVGCMLGGVVWVWIYTQIK